MKTATQSTEMIEVSSESSALVKHVGPLAMNPEVLKEYEGYPIVTKPGFKWLISIQDGKCVGFLAFSVNEEKQSANLQNCFVSPELRKHGIFKKMYNEFIKRIPAKSKVELIATDTGKAVFKGLGYKVTKDFTKWHKMEKQL
jgi:predicted GNAT family acetyltransferase